MSMRRILWPRLVCLLAVVAITLSFHLRPVQPPLLDPAQPALSDTGGLDGKAIAEQGTAKQEIRSGSAAHRAVPRGADDPLALPAIAASRPAGIGK
ncbi:hypothetical protein, partial [Nitratireductor sp. ZSWI3]|uniref:hypothetical protein n=1 Tax=Nitratireductor sp. ZSWI3 TaxID=2966359 RepID=UPI00215012E4